jgi:UDP-GlcNAc3NAcA epimerase
MLEAIEAVIGDERPDAVLVYGDTNSTLAAALAASKLHVPVAHVEAGLRSFNRRMPEEINRVVADHLSAWLFCPTQVAVDNLAAEGLTRGVEKVGDVMYDGMLHYRARAKEAALAQAGVERGRYVLATVHRAENTDDPARLRAVFDALALAAAALGRVVLALHPRTRARLIEQAIEVPPGVHVIDPAPYLEMIALLANARAVMTDSGGVQKEAFFLEVPCITMREETEWLETTDCGANRLAGADPQRARLAVEELAAGRWKPDFSARPYGSGHAAAAIVASLAGAFT